MLNSLEFGVCFCQDGYKQEGNACVEYSCETDCDACPDSSLCALCSAGKDITTSDLTLCYCPDGTTRTNEGVCGSNTCPDRGTTCHADCCDCDVNGNKSQYACTSCFDANKELRPVENDSSLLRCQCRDGFILGDDNQCHHCPIYGCTQCDASGACLGCKAELNFLPAAPTTTAGVTACQCQAGFTWSATAYACIEDCVAGTYRVASSDTDCTGVCDARCATCERAGFCTSCKAGYNQSITTYTEFECSCPDGQYWDVDQCADCDVRCAKCTSSTRCTVCADIPDLAVRAANEIGPCNCKEHFVWDGAACVFDGECEIGTFGDCSQDCFERCETCDAADETACTTCPVNSYRSDAGAATSACSAEPWFGWDSAAQAFVACPGFCRRCTDGVCDTCVEDAEKDAAGLCSCYAGYTGENGTYCREPETGTECPLGEFPFVSASGATYCEICGTNCNICTSATVCTTCRPPFTLQTTTSATAGVTTSTCTCAATTDANYYEYLGECIKCHITCSACYGPNADQCLRCIGLAHDFNRNQVDYLLENGSCVCPNASWEQQADGSCTAVADANCADDELFNDLNVCTKCNMDLNINDALCNRCTYDLITDVSECLECIAGASKDRQTGTCGCETGYYDATTGSCKACQDSRCEICDSDDPNFEKGVDCLECIATLQPATTKPNVCECIPGFYENSTGTGACIQILNCPDDQFFSQNSGACENCGKLCKSCHNTDDSRCISCQANSTLRTADTATASGSYCDCDSGYIYINGRCDALRVCPDGQYVDTVNANTLNTCLACAGQCKTCTGSANACTDCNTGLTLQTSGTSTQGDCVCPSGYFRNDNQNYTCQLCDVSCLRCASAATCTAGYCAAAYRDDSTAATGCACRIDEGYYEIQGSCQPCNSSCTTCSGGANYQCLSCKANSEPFNVYENNQNIGQGCKCNDGYYFSNNQQLCVVRPATTDCATVSFVDESTNTCTACDATCRDCLSIEATQCTGCSYDRQFIRNSGNGLDQDVQVTGICQCWRAGETEGTCDPYNCEDGYYRDSSDTTLPPKCAQCPPENNCATCIGALATDCVTCPSNMERSDANTLTANRITGSNTCVCKTDFKNADGTCATSEPVSVSCGDLSVQRCTDSVEAGCQWINGQLQNPTASCLQYMYPICCEDVARCTNLTGIDQTAECTNINVVPNKCKFSNNTNKIVIKMSGRAVWQSFPNISSSAAGTAIIGAVLKQETNAETNVLEWVEYPFSEPMTCEVDHGTKQTIRCQFTNATQSAISAGDRIVIREGAYESASEFDNLDNAAQECTVEAPTNPPTLDINLGNWYRTEPKCQSSIEIDTSLTTGKGSCALTYDWYVNMGSDNGSQTLSSTGTYADGSPQLGTDYKLTLLKHQYEDYDFISGYVRITTCWGTEGVADFYIDLQDAVTIPEITMNRSSRTIKRSQKARFQIKTKASSCDNAAVSSFQYRFDILDSQKNSTTLANGYWSTFLLDNFDSNKGILKIPRYAFEAGRDYNITVGATADGINYGEGQIYVEVIQSPLDVVVDGGNRAANVNFDVVLDNLGTTDPDYPGSTDFTCSWTCEDWTSINIKNPYYSQSINSAEWNELDDEEAAIFLGYAPGICFSQTGGQLTLNSSDGRTITITGGTMPANSLYYFKSACTKNGITTNGYQYIKGIQSTGEVTIEPKQLKPNWKNKLRASITSDDPNAYVEWSLENDVDGFSFKGRTNRKRVVFDSSLLQSGTVYTFRADLYEYGSLTAVFATLDTMLLSPPYGGSFTISPTSGTIDTTFTATFANWETSDDSEIEYKINVVDQSGKTVASQYSLLTEMTSKFPGSLNGSSQAIYYVSAQVFNDNGYSSTPSTLVVISQPTTEQVQDATTTTKQDYDANQNTWTLSEQIDTLGRVTNYAGQTNDTDSQVWAEQKINALPYSEMTTQDCEQVTTTIAQSGTFDNEEIIKTAITSIMTTIMAELVAETNSPTDNFLALMLQSIGKLSGKILGSGRRLQTVTDQEKQLYDLNSIALYNDGVDSTCNTINSDTMTSTACLKSKQDLTMTITSPDEVLADGTTSTTTTTHDNKNGKVKVPTCHIRDTDDDEYQVQITSGQQTSQFANYTEQAGYEFDISIYQSDGTYEPGSASCADMIDLELGMKLPDDVNIGNLTTWDYYSSPPLEDGSVFKAVFWDDVNGVWSEAGINQTATVLDFVNDKIYTQSSHMSAFTLVVEKEQPVEVITIEATVDSDSDDDDDWNYLKHLNALYVGLGLAVIMSLLIVAGVAHDKRSSTIVPAIPNLSPEPQTAGMTESAASTDRKLTKTETEVLEIGQPVSMFEDHQHKMVFKNRQRTGPSSNATEQMHMQTQMDIVSKDAFVSSHCEGYREIFIFLFSNNIIGEILTNRKSGYTRLARILIFFTIFQAIITLSAVFYELGLIWYAAGLAAAVCGLMIEPILTFLLYLGKGKNSVAKIIIGVVTAIVINGGCLGYTALLADESGETFTNDWLLSMSLGFGAFFLVGQQICSIYKYVLYRTMGANF